MIMLGYANLFGFYPALTTYANNVDLYPFKYYTDFMLKNGFYTNVLHYYIYQFHI